MKDEIKANDIHAQVIAMRAKLAAQKLAAERSDPVTIAEAAAILRVSLRTARRRQAEGLMPARRKIRRAWMYERTDVVQLRDSIA
jgi:hypothetical protein